MTDNITPRNWLSTVRRHATQRELHATTVFSNKKLTKAIQMITMTTSLENWITRLRCTHTEAGRIFVLDSVLHLWFREQLHPVSKSLLDQLLKILSHCVIGQAIDYDTTLLVINHKAANRMVSPQSTIGANLFHRPCIATFKIHGQGSKI